MSIYNISIYGKLGKRKEHSQKALDTTGTIG